MFSKKNIDVKKSALKIQDTKKDLATRVKHLKVILENAEISESKGLFETNFSHIYSIFYDLFIQAETNLRQRELSFHLVHKTHKEELEAALWILEQILSLLPELIHKRWQIHSLGRVLSKLLHPSNNIKLRRQAIRFFLMWYQALNDNAPEQIHEMFALLIPGFTQITSPAFNFRSSVFHDQVSVENPVMASEILPILLPAGTEQPSKVFMEILLEGMATTVVRLEWYEKQSHHHRCFNFLLERFKIHYLPKICSNFSHRTSLYQPNLDLPVVRKAENDSELVACRVTLIKWIINYIHQTKKVENTNQQPTSGHASLSTAAAAHTVDEENHESSHPSLDSQLSLQTSKAPSDEEFTIQIVREVLYSTRDNVNFLHELFRQAFLLNFNYAVAIRKTIALYKDIIQGNLLEVPPYLLEITDEMLNRNADNQSEELSRPPRLRNDSYLGAIHKENLLVRAGLQNVLQLFMTHASNVFLLEANMHFPTLLEEQTDACKRVLNIYRYMVMHTRMDSTTWEQLLLVLLQITSLVLRDSPNKKKHTSLGSKLAPAIFQTLIVTWIKANLNVMIGHKLWDRFLDVLISLTHWEELVKEWAKTMETLTRVLARHVYNLDLTDLPLDRLLEQKNRRTRKITAKTETSASVSYSSSSSSSFCRQDSTTTVPDSTASTKVIKSGITRSYSETNLSKNKSVNKLKINRLHRSHSLDNFRQNDTESTDRTRSPSPAPSSGIESTSIKDAPIQLDVLVSESNIHDAPGENRGVVCGGSVRGWLPDVAVILWKRMLGALGDVNEISDPKLHAQVFEYLVKLIDTLIKIKLNQGISADNQSTPNPPELVPPITLILPWCFGAFSLPDSFESGKIIALRLLCTITVHCDSQYRSYLPHFYRTLHTALIGTSRPALNMTIRHLGPRFISLQVPGSSLLLLDLIQASNRVLLSSDLSQSTPRTEAVSILAGLLCLPKALSKALVLQPDSNTQLIPCPDVKEHIVDILLRTGNKEPTGMARCIAITALGHFIYRELINKTYHGSITDALKIILLSLKFENKVIAHMASNLLFLLCDHAILLWNRYPRLTDSIIRCLCDALFFHVKSNTTPSDSDKALITSILMCLGEWCIRLGSNRLLKLPEYNDNKTCCLLLLVFNVLNQLVKGKTEVNIISDNSVIKPDEFEANILLDNLSKGSGSSSKNQHNHEAVTLCAQTILTHLVTHLGHFPMSIGASRLCSLVVEHDDVPDINSDELSADIFSAPNIQLFMLTPSIVASLIELPALDLPGGGITAGLATENKQVRVLLRDLSGKASWDASILYKSPDVKSNEEEVSVNLLMKKAGPVSFIQPESLMVINVQSNLQQRAMRHRNPNILPNVENSAPDLDQLDDLLQYLGHTSPECLEYPDKKLNEPLFSPIPIELEAEIITSVISERNNELEQSKAMQHMNAILAQPESRPTKAQDKHKNSIHLNNNFQQCRLLFSQLGLASRERRKQLNLLNKTDRLLRELRNSDTQRCRETHKVAIIYVAPGQEDKNSILSNQGGSVAYEQFLAALAWEVELEGHTGFLGGLQRQGSTGLTAPYYATSFLEVIFHVATRMPGETPEAVLNKTRHLGNDEVHVVWSEHFRDYRRDIIPTEFCDVLITIYPLNNNLNRVTINCKPEVPYFGLLFDEAIVENNILAGIIRAVVICASRAKRSTLPFYQQFYEERARSLNTVLTKYREATTYEDFISRVYSPVTTVHLVGGSYCNSIDGSSNSTASSTLAAALIDSHKSELKFKGSEPKGVWFNHSEISQNVECTSISPRPLKKLQTTLKNVPRRSIRQDNANDTPPESPTQFIRKK